MKTIRKLQKRCARNLALCKYATHSDPIEKFSSLMIYIYILERKILTLSSEPGIKEYVFTVRKLTITAPIKELFQG